MHRVLAWITIFVLLLVFGSSCGRLAQKTTYSVRINEVQSAGADADWIELFNTGDTTVSLKGCFFSDDPDSPGKWMFPNITLDAGEYVLLYADKGETTPSHLSLPFYLNAAGETLVLSDPNGTPIDTLVMPESAAAVSYGYHTDNQTVWYASPTPGADNKNGMVLGSQSVNTEQGIRINEYMSRNQSFLHDEDGDYSDWVELYNLSENDIVLDGYYLTDSKQEITKWQFPRGTVVPAGEYLLVFCSKKDKHTENGEYHTNFRLGNNDAFLGLYTANGVFCSGVTYHPTEQNRSIGYTDDGTYQPCHYPTPRYANS